ncbi:MAG: AraC family transcriptional regulator [Bacteroidota bacterium]
MKPLFEKIEKNFGSSFTVRKYQELDICTKPFWHIHPEYELVYIKNGHGKRHVGDSITTYTEGDLILLAPNVPHACFSNHIHPNNFEVVIQFEKDFAGKGFWNMPEMTGIKQLLNRAIQGISFGKNVRSKLENDIILLSSEQGFARFTLLIQILHELSMTENFELLRANMSSLLVKSHDYSRINRVYDFIEANFQQALSPEEVADHIHMTLPAFCRFFKRTTEKTFTTFLNEFRVSHACQLIIEGSYTMSEISELCGFQSASYFNKQFKKIVDSTPSEYRSSIIKVLTHQQQ